MQTLYRKVGSQDPWVGVVTEGGEPKSLTLATSLAIYARRVGSSTPSVTAGVATKNADQTTYPGRWSYTPQLTEVATPGVYHVLLKITWSGGSISKAPSKGYAVLVLEEDLAD